MTSFVEKAKTEAKEVFDRLKEEKQEVKKEGRSASEIRLGLYGKDK